VGIKQGRGKERGRSRGREGKKGRTGKLRPHRMFQKLAPMPAHTMKNNRVGPLTYK